MKLNLAFFFLFPIVLGMEPQALYLLVLVPSLFHYVFRTDFLLIKGISLSMICILKHPEEWNVGIQKNVICLRKKRVSIYLFLIFKDTRYIQLCTVLISICSLISYHFNNCMSLFSSSNNHERVLFFPHITPFVSYTNMW